MEQITSFIEMGAHTQLLNSMGIKWLTIFKGLIVLVNSNSSCITIVNFRRTLLTPFRLC